MKTKLILSGFILAACSFLLGGCVEEMPGAQGTPKTLNEIHGTMSEAVRTKAYLTEGNDVRWEYRDKIGVFSDLTTEFVPFPAMPATRMEETSTRVAPLPAIPSMPSIPTKRQSRW